jgi:hypothetical protein
MSHTKRHLDRQNQSKQLPVHGLRFHTSPTKFQALRRRQRLLRLVLGPWKQEHWSV